MSNCMTSGKIRSWRRLGGSWEVTGGRVASEGFEETCLNDLFLGVVQLPVQT